MEPLERALSELQDQNYGSAIRTLEMVTARDPSSAEAYKHLSQAYYRTNQREKAAEAAQRYAALKPTDPSAHYNVGALMAQLGQAGAAERAFRAALSADPAYGKAREALAKLAPESAGAAATTSPQLASSFSKPESLTVLTPAAPAEAPAPTETREKQKRGPMPLPAKIAAGLTLVAIAAILLWLFLPGGRANPGPPKTMPEPSPHPITTPPPNQPTAENPLVAQTPQPTPNPLVQPSPNPQPTPLPTPQPDPNQPLPTPPQPSAAAPGASSPPRPIFTPQQAQAVAEQMDAAERQQMEGQLRVLANWLRHDKACQDPDFWPILQTALATQGPSMVPGGASIGTGEVISLITQSETNVQAADAIERYSRDVKAALPWNVKQQIVQALSLATSANEAYSAAQTVLQRSNTTLSQQALDQLRQAAQQAEQAANQRVTAGR